MTGAAMPAVASKQVDRRRPLARVASTLEVEDTRPLLAGKRLASEAPANPSRTAVVACAALAVFYFAAYATSLQGGTHSRDLQWINAHLNIIGRSIILSILFFTAFLWAARLLGSAAWPARAGLAAVHLAFLAWDHGGDFQYHGFYNWVLFLIIALPLNLVLLGLFFWYTSMRPRTFALSFVGSGAATALIVSLMLLHYQRLATFGFLGHRLQPGCTGKHCPPGSEPNCNFASTLPFIDLLPKGAQNFWTGSQHCKRIHGFEATLSDSGLLTISRCPAHETQTYTPMPNTRLWSVEQKTHKHATYQSNVLKALKAEPYKKLVQLRAETEAVLARCGDAERLLTRVVPMLERKAPEPPLLLLGNDAGEQEPERSGKVETAAAEDAAEDREAASDAAEEAGEGADAAAKQGEAQGSSSGQPAGQAERLNVILIFIDSLGRRQFFRRMPKSAAALEAVARRGASRLYQFFRYHVVGFHTDPNTHALYAGSPIEDQHAQPFWSSYRRAGYVSGSVYNLCEDWGTEYDKLQTPHDHELVAPFCLPEYHPVTPDGEPYQMFKGAFSILRRCLRGRHVHEYNFQWMRQFMAAYDGRAPWLLMSSFHEAHEGTGEVVATMDADLARFYEELTPELLNRTAVITVADHGATMGLNYMYTNNGRITEHKIPLLAMLLPAWVEQRYPAAAAALRANEQRLLTAFDIFTTFHHLLHLGESDAPPKEQYEQWRVAGNVTQAVRWGVSLLDEIPAGRSCQEAGVPPEWCMCTLPA